jgi:hypothetical protein
MSTPSDFATLGTTPFLAPFFVTFSFMTHDCTLVAARKLLWAWDATRGLLETFYADLLARALALSGDKLLTGSAFVVVAL